MSRVFFYFDKGCIDKANEKLKEIFIENGVSGVQVSSSFSSLPEMNKDFISYDISQRFEETQPEVVCNKIEENFNNIVRNFNWESIGVTGFEEVKCAPAAERDVEIKMVGLVNEEFIKKLQNSVV